MLEKITKKIKPLPREPKSGEVLCNTCDGIGWLIDTEEGYMEKCRACYNGVIPLCPDCGTPAKGQCLSEGCREKRAERQEQRLLDKAIKAKFSDVPAESITLLFSESYSYNDGYFSELYEIVEHCESEGVPVPKYVWSTKRVELTLDAEHIVSSACEELHEDSFNRVVNLDELQAYLDTWCEKQLGTETYVVDYKYAIEVDVDLDEAERLNAEE